MASLAPRMLPGMKHLPRPQCPPLRLDSPANAYLPNQPHTRFRATQRDRFMKKLSCTLLVCLPLWAFAQQQDCETLPDNDDKAMCAAMQQKATRFCDTMSSSDKNFLCMAKVQPNSYTCEKINSSGLRSECLLHVKKVQQAAIYTNQSSKKP